jgi:hypothetical protein
MAISRSQMERQLRNMGGIMSLQQPRQGYFLGKLVKKAAKVVKKVAKSPVGKAAILGALTFGIPGTQFSGLAGGKGLAGLKGKLFGLGGRDAFMGAGPTKGLFGKLGLTKGAGSLGLTGLGKIASIGGLSGLAGLMAAGEQDEEEIDFSKLDRGEGLNILDIVARARKNDPEFRFLPGAEFTGSYAEGGKVDTESDEYIMDNEESQALFGKFPIQLSLEEQMMLYGRKKYAEGGIGSLAMNKENVPQMYVSDEAGALPKKMKDGEGGVLPSDMGKLKRSDFETEEDYKRYLRQLNKKAEGGIMDLGGMEMDLRGGGFVPLGAKEKADDVPARLSKNEFVMTADAVRAAGGGSIDKGADKMYNLMKDLESRV